MNLDFPQGDLYYLMSDDLQHQFYQKMKDAVWAITLKMNEDDEFDSTGFCIDPRGLILTAAHLLEVEGEEEDDDGKGKEEVDEGNDKWKEEVNKGKGKGKRKEGSSKVEIDEGKGKGTTGPPEMKLFARRDKDNEPWRCEVVYELKHFDLLLLQVHGGDDCGGFDYVSIDGQISRNIPCGRDVFIIGICKIQGFHLLRGRLTYSHKHDEIDYITLAKEEKFETRRRTKDLNFNQDRTYRVRKGSLASDKMHPELTYLQTQFMGITEFGGVSGAPVFDSIGRVIGMAQSDQFSLKGATSAAMEAMLKCYLESVA